MLIPTFFFVVLVIILNWCTLLNLVDSSTAEDVKLSNIKKINVLIFVVVLCYISLFIGKVVL